MFDMCKLMRLRLWLPGCDGAEIARYQCCYGSGIFVFDPLHYLALLEIKPNALDQAASLRYRNLPEAFQYLRHLEARMHEPSVGQQTPTSIPQPPVQNAAHPCMRPQSAHSAAIAVGRISSSYGRTLAPFEATPEGLAKITMYS